MPRGQLCNVWKVRVGRSPESPVREYPCFVMERGAVCVVDRARFWVCLDERGAVYIDPAKPIPYIEPSGKLHAA